MIDHDVGIGDLPQRLAFVALLPARFLAGPVPQARHPRRLLQPITRRRLAAVRTVQPEPALELRQPRLQRRILGLQGRDQREKVVHRWRTRRRFASYPMLESEPVSSVERIFSPNPAVAQPGQLRPVLYALPERGVTFHTGDMGDTFGPLRESRGPWKECHVMDERVKFISRMLDGEAMPTWPGVRAALAAFSADRVRARQLFQLPSGHASRV